MHDNHQLLFLLAREQHQEYQRLADADRLVAKAVRAHRDKHRGRDHGGGVQRARRRLGEGVIRLGQALAGIELAQAAQNGERHAG